MDVTMMLCLVTWHMLTMIIASLQSAPAVFVQPTCSATKPWVIMDRFSLGIPALLCLGLLPPECQGVDSLERKTPDFWEVDSLGRDCYMWHCQPASAVFLSAFLVMSQGWNAGRPAHCHPLHTRELALLRRCIPFLCLALCLKVAAPVDPFLEGVSVRLISSEPPTVDWQMSTSFVCLLRSPMWAWRNADNTQNLITTRPSQHWPHYNTYRKLWLFSAPHC